jgi:hypothetical protein
MSKWLVGMLAISLLAVSICVAVVFQYPRPRDLSADESSRLDLQPGMGRAAGIVVDSGDFLPEGATPQTYIGASIVIRRAVEAGTYRVGEEEPEHTNYEAGDIVAEAESGEGGCWQADLDPGRYFIRAFYGQSSYSVELLIDIEEGAVLSLRLELLHGV